MPFLAAPSPNGEALLEDAIRQSTRIGLVAAGDYVVVVQRVHDDFCIKIVEINADSNGILRGGSGIDLTTVNSANLN